MKFSRESWSGAVQGWAAVAGLLLSTLPAAVLLLTLPAAALPPPLAAGALEYPTAPRDSVVDDYHGVLVPDPWRPLEDMEAERTVAWVKAENSLTSGWLRQIPERDAIQARLRELSNYGRTEVPWREAGRLFFRQSNGTAPQPVLCVRKSLKDRSRVLFDPNTISPDGSIQIGDFVVSPDGRRLAYLMSPGGADTGDIHVRDLESGRDLPDIVRGTSVCWTRDSRGFFYARSRAASEGTAPAPRAGKEARYHAIGSPTAADPVLIDWDEKARWVYSMASEDGRYALIVAEEGLVSQVYAIDLVDPHHPAITSPPFELLAADAAFHTPIDIVGTTLYLRTNLDAPRSRIVALDLAQGAVARPRDVIPEQPGVIVDAVIAGQRIAVNYLEDVKSRVRLFGLDGTARGEVALPGIGAVAWPLSGRPSRPDLFYSFSSFLVPPSTFHCDVRSGRSRPFQPVTTRFDAGRYVTRQIEYASKDGTRVPLFVTGARDLQLDGSHPVFLTGYGGYGMSFEPHFESDIPLWLEMGGIYVVANIRGGGEFGEDWHRAGMLEKKQTSFNDFIAAAEFLVSERYTGPDRLAIYGHSNGGLLIGAVLTQRPDLFGAAVANAGHYDMLRYHRFTAGAGWVTEYGSPDDPAAFPYLKAYSPLQKVREGTCYPATLLLAADHDDRVVPLHAYKFAAALQAAQACDHPILLRVAENASHSYASRQEWIAERSDMWAFIASRLGIAGTTRAR